MELVKVCLIGGENDKKKWLNSILGSSTNDECIIGCEVHPYLFSTKDMVFNFWSIHNMEDGLAHGFTQSVDYYIVFDESHVKYTKGAKYVLYKWDEETNMIPLWSIYCDRMELVK